MHSLYSHLPRTVYIYNNLYPENIIMWAYNLHRVMASPAFWPSKVQKLDIYHFHVAIGVCQPLVCENGGNCVEFRGEGTCDCVPGFEGITCDKDGQLINIYLYVDIFERCCRSSPHFPNLRSLLPSLEVASVSLADPTVRWCQLDPVLKYTPALTCRLPLIDM